MSLPYPRVGAKTPYQARCRKYCHAHAQAQAAEVEKDHEYVRSYARRSWPRFWFSMACHNLLAAANDIREGIRVPASVQRRRRGSRRGREQADGLGTGTQGRTTRCAWLSRVRCCGMSLSRPCCGVSAAPTLPVPPSLPTSRAVDEWKKTNGYDMYGDGGGEGSKPHQQGEDGGSWSLPSKLRAAGRGAGSWGGDTMMMSTRSSLTPRPPSPAGGRTHRRGGNGSGGTATTGRMGHLGRSGIFGSSGGGAGGLSVGRLAAPSVFGATPVPVDEPRKRSCGATSRGSGSLLGSASGKTDVGRGGFGRTRGSGGSGGSSGRGVIASMFSPMPVPVDEPRKTMYGTGHSASSGGRRGFTQGGQKGGGNNERGGVSGGAPTMSVPSTLPVPFDESWRTPSDTGRSDDSLSLGRFGGRGEAGASFGRQRESGRGLISGTSKVLTDEPGKVAHDAGCSPKGRGMEGFGAGGEMGGSTGRGGASGRGLFSNTSPIPMYAPRKKTHEWAEIAKGDDEERGTRAAGRKGRETTSETGGG